MAPVPFVLFCCVFSSGDLRVVAVWPGFCLCLSGFALNCRTKVFHIVCFSFTRFSHCWNRASEQNRPQYRKKSIAAGGGGSALPAQKLSQEKMQDHMDWTRYTVHGSPQCQKLCGSSLLPFFVCSRFLFVFP